MSPKITAMFSTPVKAITTIASVVTAIGVIIGAILTVDGRYVHAADYIKAQEQQQQQMQIFQRENRQKLDEFRKQGIEDKLFELRLKSPKTKADDALIKRFEEQLQEVINRMNQNLSSR